MREREGEERNSQFNWLDEWKGEGERGSLLSLPARIKRPRKSPPLSLEEEGESWREGRETPKRTEMSWWDRPHETGLLRTLRREEGTAEEERYTQDEDVREEKKKGGKNRERERDPPRLLSRRRKGAEIFRLSP